jgi:hypothetical protein
MNKKQTVVDWLESKLPSLFIPDSGHYKQLFDQAKEMEFQQIVNAYNQGVTDEYGETLDFTNDTDAEEYYNKNYGQ